MRKATPFVLLSLGLACACGGTEAKIERAIEEALAPENALAMIIELAKLGTGDHEEDRRRLREAVGSDNFTSWMLLASRETMEEVAAGDFVWVAPEVANPAAFAQYLSEHHTAVGMDDVSSIEWENQEDSTIIGRFSIDVPSVRATLLFSARMRNGGIEITKLVVASRSSMKVSDGLVIFDKG